MVSENITTCPICSESGNYYTTKNEFEVYSCPNCEMLFTPQMNEKIVEKEYDQMVQHWLEGCVSPELMQEVLEIARMFQAPPEEVNILDFGTGNANLPQFLRGYGYSAYAVDIVKDQAVFPWWYYRGNIFDARYPREFFDLITAIQVFEHLYDPKPIISEFTRIIKPGGIIYIHTDMELPERDIEGENWYYIYPPHHCSIYRHRTFEVLLQNYPQLTLESKGEKEIIIRKFG